MIKISVIICSHNPREASLPRVLDALKSQSLPLEDWELLLIDNASQIPLRDRFPLAWHPLGRHLSEPTLGKLNAWFLAIREAKGDILIFVDDDNVLAGDYLEQALIISQTKPFIGAWAGNIVPECKKPLPAWIGDQAWRLAILEVKKDVWSNLHNDFSTMPVGAGMCIRKEVGKRYLEWCDGNQNRLKLDRSGKGLGGYGDIDLGFCALDIGLGTGLFASLRLTHLIPESRLTLGYFVRHAEGDAISLMLFKAIRGLPIQQPKSITPVRSIRWFLHRLIHRTPREQYEIAKAHQRGLEKGWQLAQTYLKETSSAQKPIN
jgi:glycosyltransferase involved in cell wall biosynthesis